MTASDICIIINLYIYGKRKAHIRNHELVCIIDLVRYCQLRWHPFLLCTLNPHVEWYLSHHVLCVLFFTRCVSSPNTSNILDHVNMHTCENPTNLTVSIQHFQLYKSCPPLNYQIFFFYQIQLKVLVYT